MTGSSVETLTDGAVELRKRPSRYLSRKTCIAQLTKPVGRPPLPRKPRGARKRLGAHNANAIHTRMHVRKTEHEKKSCTQALVVPYVHGHGPVYPANCEKIVPSAVR